MSIINKIKFFKNIKNILVFRSKYDNVCDELDYKNLEISRCNDSLFAIQKNNIAINNSLADKYMEIEKLKKILIYLCKLGCAFVLVIGYLLTIILI